MTPVEKRLLGVLPQGVCVRIRIPWKTTMTRRSWLAEKAAALASTGVVNKRQCAEA